MAENRARRARGEKNVANFNRLCKEYNRWKDTDMPWLFEYPVALSRTIFAQGDAEIHRGGPGGRQRIRGGQFRLKRGLQMEMVRPNRVGRYGDPVPKSASIFEDRGRWCVSICNEMDAVETKPFLYGAHKAGKSLFATGNALTWRSNFFCLTFLPSRELCTSRKEA